MTSAVHYLGDHWQTLGPLRLLLVRHCEASGQDPPAALTPKGLKQAATLAKFLAAKPVDAVMASEYLRARQNAQPLADALGLSVAVDDRLNERNLSPEPIDNWREVVRDSFLDPERRAPGGESAAEVLERAWAGLVDLLAGDSTLPVVVSHGNLISLVLNSVDASFGFHGWENMSNPDVYVVESAAPGKLRFERIWDG